jgi:CRP-like cAMP-binding protein
MLASQQPGFKEMMDFLDSIYRLPKGLRDRLEQKVQYRKLEKGEFILHAGEVCRHIYFISKGLLRCYYLTGKDNEEEVSTWFMKETDACVSIDSFYDQVESYEFIHALEACVVFYISYDDLEAAYKDYIDFNVVGRILTLKYLKEWARQLRGIRKLSATERYLALEAREPELVLRVPGMYLASYLDMASETLSRIRGKRI